MSIVSKHTSDTIKDAMGKLSGLPTPVDGWIVETGIDSADEEAVWVWAMLKEDKVEFNKIEELESIITKRVKKLPVLIPAHMFVSVASLRKYDNHGSP